MFSKIIIAIALVALVRAEPPHEVYPDTVPDYTFKYSVEDPKTGDSKSQHETRHGDVVEGVYSLAEPDGTIRTVEYAADPHSGFVAKVSKSGDAKHPATVPLAYAAPAPVAYHAPIAYHAPVAYHAPAVSTVYQSAVHHAPTYASYASYAPLAYHAPAVSYHAPAVSSVYQSSAYKAPTYASYAPAVSYSAPAVSSVYQSSAYKAPTYASYAPVVEYHAPIAYSAPALKYYKK